ncbi:MAG: hypothetical protein B6A08_20450 [Sorangiineae bacterium NIC37A_2]|nr:MAG: hypothetical protein B6A08_20450 [Sorangiineae bacterium NIC37A_2]
MHTATPWPRSILKILGVSERGGAGGVAGEVVPISTSLTTKEAAAYLGMRPASVRKLVHEGRLVPVGRRGGLERATHVFEAAEVERFKRGLPPAEIRTLGSPRNGVSQGVDRPDSPKNGESDGKLQADVRIPTSPNEVPQRLPAAGRRIRRPRTSKGSLGQAEGDLQGTGERDTTSGSPIPGVRKAKDSGRDRCERSDDALQRILRIGL